MIHTDETNRQTVISYQFNDKTWLLAISDENILNRYITYHVTVTFKESMKVEMGIMEAKFESAQRTLEAELASQMEKEVIFIVLTKLSCFFMTEQWKLKKPVTD